MNRTKFKISIFALALVFILSFAAFFGVNSKRFKSANAAGTVSVNSSSVFTASGEANVVVYMPKTEEDKSEKVGYTMFTFGYDEDNVSYRRNLAYNWFEEITEEGESDKTEGEEGEGDEEKEPAVSKRVVNGLFNMEIGFPNTAFKKYVITFESQQYEKSEDGKSVNYIMFFPSEEAGKVHVLVTDDKDATVEDAKGTVTLYQDRIYINFGIKEGGSYPVYVKDTPDSTGNQVIGHFVNVGGNYSKYSSSSTTPVYPLIFSAEFDKDEEGKDKKEDKEAARMILYCLNNQKFEVKNSRKNNDNDDYYVGGTVEDLTPAVLCLNKEISHLNIGGSISFDYQLIDVLRSSPSSTLHYYVLKYEDTKAEIDYNDYKRKGEDDKEVYAEVQSDILLDSDKGDYLPTLYNRETGEVNDGGKAYGKNFKIDMAVKVYAEIKDTSSNGETSYVFLDWYLSEDLKLTINGYDFIAVGDNLDGVTYNTNDPDKSWDEIKADYQKKVDEAAKNLSAGSNSYFYVPSAETLFADDATAYQDMKISIYYYSSTQSSNTSLSANNLSINVTKPGSYRFTLYATDAASNKMYYIDADGEVVEFASSDIWDIYADDEKHDYLPWFSFNVDYKGAQITDPPGKQSTAYVGTSYSAATFEVNGVENSYSIKYRLFLFDRAGYYAKTGLTYSYEEFIEVMDELFAGSDTRIYFKEIKEVNESDEDYEEFKDYGWKSSSTTFVPQDGNAFYYMRAEVTDTEYNTDPITSSLAIQSSIEAKALKGESEWLKNNVASVILLSVAGVSLVAIILLLVIKPKNKEDIDVQFEKMSAKKSAKKSK